MAVQRAAIAAGKSTRQTRAAVDAREDLDFMIDARSDACWVTQDLQASITPLKAYAQAGADMLFPTMLPPPLLQQVRRYGHA